MTTIAQIQNATALTHAPDGSLYVLGTVNQVEPFIYRIDPLGNVTVFAGTGTTCSSPTALCGDGGPAISAQFVGVTGLSWGPDGSLYMADGNRVRRVTPDGMINTIAGTGGCGGGPQDDGKLASGVLLGPLQNVLAAPDGNIYFAQNGCGTFVRYVKPDGTIATAAGTVTGTFGDGQPALSTLLSNLTAIAMAPDQTLVFSDQYRVRQIASDGTLTTIAGNLSACAESYCGDGVPATATFLGATGGITFAPDGSLLISAGGDTERVLRVTPPLPHFGVANYIIPSADGRELYVFDTTGRHLQTSDALTGAQTYTFGYDPQSSRLTSILYAPGTSHLTTIAYDDANATRTVTSPFGDVTTLALDGSGNLSTLSRQGRRRSASSRPSPGPRPGSRAASRA